MFCFKISSLPHPGRFILCPSWVILHRFEVGSLNVQASGPHFKTQDLWLLGHIERERESVHVLVREGERPSLVPGPCSPACINSQLHVLQHPDNTQIIQLSVFVTLPAFLSFSVAHW